MATEQEYRSILIPNQPFRRLKIADYISQGKKKKLFKGEYIRTSAKTIDDLYYYYIDEGQIVATFEQESGEVAPLYWRNAGNAFSAEYTTTRPSAATKRASSPRRTPCCSRSRSASSTS